MENKKMCLALYSGSIDKLTAAGVILSGAVADDMEVDVYVLLQAARAFKKEIAYNKDELKLAENSHLREEFLNSLKQLNVKEWHAFFKEAKEISKVKFHICGITYLVYFLSISVNSIANLSSSDNSRLTSIIFSDINRISEVNVLLFKYVFIHFPKHFRFKYPTSAFVLW